MSRFFRVLSGQHEHNGVRYAKDAIIETNDSTDLVKAFKGRFEEVSHDVANRLHLANANVVPADDPVAKAVAAGASALTPSDNADKPSDKPSKGKKAPKSKGKGKAADKPSGKADKGSKYGTDVTSQFKEARELDLLVFQSGDKYAIFDSANPDEPLKANLSLDGIPTFISEFLDNEEDDDEE